MQTTRGATPLMYACQQCMEREVSDILTKQPYTVRDRDRTLKTPLHYCAENASVICAEAILKIAPELVNAKDENGYCPLHLAVIAGNKPLIKLLISKGTNVNSRDNEGHSAVHWAIVSSEKEALEIIIRSGANASTPDVHGGYPLHYAVQMCGSNGDSSRNPTDAIKVVQTLLHFGVDVNVKDKDGRQPILWAASAGSADAVIHLVNGGASVEAADKDGLTALHCAASRGHTDTLETLVTLCGANVDVIDANGCSALFYSVTLGHADCTELLLQLGAEPNRQDRKGRTPAHCGAAKGQLETLRILQKHGGNLWVKNIKGDLPLHEAIASGRKDLVLWLLSQNPDAVNIPNKDGRCLIHIAAMHNNSEMIKVLLDSKSLINPVMRTSKGILMTPLNVALSKGHRSCGKFLQLHGGVPFSKVLKTEPNFLYAVRVSPSEDMMKTGEANAAVLSPSSRFSKTNLSPDSQVIVKSDNGDKKKVYRRRKKRNKVNDKKDSDSDESGEETHNRTQGIRKSSDNDGVSGKRTVRNENENVQVTVKNIKLKTEAPDGNGNEKKSVTAEMKDEVVEETISVKKVTKARTDSKPLQRALSEHKNVSDLSPEDFPPLMQNINHLDAEMMETEIDESKPSNENENVEVEIVAGQSNTQVDGGAEDVEKASRSEEKGLEIRNEKDSLQITVVSGDLSLGSSGKEGDGGDKTGNGNEIDGKAKSSEAEEVKVVNEEEGEGKGGKGLAARHSSGGSSGSQKNGKTKKNAIKRGSKSSGSTPSDEKFLRNSTEGVSNRKMDKTTKSSSRASASGHSSENPAEKDAKPIEVDVSEPVNNETLIEKEALGPVQESTKTDKTPKDSGHSSENPAEKDAKLEVAVLEAVNNETLIEKEVAPPVQESKTADLVSVEGDKLAEDVTKPKDDTPTIPTQVKNPELRISDTGHENSIDTPAVTTSDGKILVREENQAKLEAEKSQANETPAEVRKESEQLVGFGPPTNETPPPELTTTAETNTTPSNADVQMPDEVAAVQMAHEVADVSSGISKPTDSGSGSEGLVIKNIQLPIGFTAEVTKFTESTEKPSEISPLDKNIQPDTRRVVETETEAGKPDLWMNGEGYVGSDVANVPNSNETAFEATDEHSRPKNEIFNEDKMKISTPFGEKSEGEKNNGENLLREKEPPVEDVVSGGEQTGSRCEKENNGCFSLEQRHHKTPRISRLCRMNRDTNEVTDISVTQLVQNTIRKYHMERGIFHQLLELKRMQIRAGRANEQVLVKRLVDEYERSKALHGMKHFRGVYKFREFEKFLYDQLKALNSRHQLIIPELKSYDDIDALSGILKKSRFRIISEMPQIDPTCTCITQRCHHTTHAYTSLPCSAYIADVRRQKSHKARKEGFLPRIEPIPSFKAEKQRVSAHPPTLELIQGSEKQVITLPQNYPEKGKRYYVTFTIKSAPSFKEEDVLDERKDFFKHRHAKSV